MVMVYEYRIIQGGLIHVEDAVNKALKDGWQPQGGVFMSVYHFVQAMVKTTANTEPS
jgi:glycerol-3-phosphate responsive antiterminator